MERIYTELDQFSQWPSGERIAALKQLLPASVLKEVLAESTLPSRYCRQLPTWFMLWFVVGIGLFSRDSYRQVYKWLQPFRRKQSPNRSTLCMARQRLGVAALHRLLARTVTLLAEPSTPGAFHRQYRLMALDGFVVDLADGEPGVPVSGIRILATDAVMRDEPDRERLGLEVLNFCSELDAR